LAPEINIRAQNQSSSSSDPSNFAELDSQTQRRAFRGLAAAAWIYAAVYFVVYAADWATEIAAQGHFAFPEMGHNIISLVSIAYSLAVALRCRVNRCNVGNFTGMASAFLVMSSTGIAVHVWGWEQNMTTDVFYGVNWVGIWLIIYPSVVTLPPKRILFASLISSLVLGAIAVGSPALHGLPPTFHGTEGIAIARLLIPVVICAGIAYFSAYRIFAMARDVSKARRLGSYELSEKIGSGGMGEVWKAKHRMLARPAAVKLIRPESMGMSTDATAARTMLRRFEREAQATATLTSQHSIILYDFGIAEDGTFYYVMELLEGRDLKSLIRERGPLPAERVVHFMRAACDSLADAHHRGLIHRDIKPANIFTCRRGREFDFVKVLDFGLVKRVSEVGEQLTQLTGTGTTSGTPGFMAPEMVTGDSPVDGRADLYALGCVGYWLLTGQMVFDGNSPMSILIQHVKEPPPPIASRTEIEVPARLEEIIFACLSKRPDDRPASAEELDLMLAEVAATLPAWTRERAEAWWRTNLPNLHAASLERSMDTGAATVINA
jgi:serine/threonine-protein kinase